MKSKLYYIVSRHPYNRQNESYILCICADRAVADVFYRKGISYESENIFWYTSIKEISFDEIPSKFKDIVLSQEQYICKDYKINFEYIKS